MISGSNNYMGNIKDISILDLIPQRRPFVLVDRLVYFDRLKTMTELVVKSDTLFVEEGRLTSPGLMENIAQTCAVRMGYINILEHDSIKLGFIGAIRDLQVLRTPLVGEHLRTSIEVKEEIFKMTLVGATINVGNEEIVKAEMKIALSDINSQN